MPFNKESFLDSSTNKGAVKAKRVSSKPGSGRAFSTEQAQSPTFPWKLLTISSLLKARLLTIPLLSKGG